MQKEKRILWVRKLSCGHERPTYVDYLFGIYEKPKKNEICYCGECNEDVKVTKSKKADDWTQKIMNKMKEMFDDVE